MPNEIPPSVTAMAPQSDPTQGMFSAAQLQAPLDNIPQSPAPIKYTPTAQELATAAPAAPVKYTPTADELSNAAPVAPNIFEAMSPEQMVAEAKSNPKQFDPLAAFQALPDDKKAEYFDKAAETYHQLRNSGHYMPSFMDMLKNAGKSIVDVAKTGATLANLGVESPVTLPNAVLHGITGEPIDTTTTLGALTKQAQQESGEFLAGQKVAALGFGQMLAKGADWAARGLHITKGLKDYTQEDKLHALAAELATRTGMAKVVRDGISPETAAQLAKEGYALRPEKVEQAASGSPYAWEGAGKLFGGATKMAGEAAAPLLATIAGDTSPAGLAVAHAAVQSLPSVASDLSARAVGRTVQALSRVGEKAAELTEPLVKPVAQVAGGVGGAFAGHHIAGPWSIPIGVAEGVAKGGELGEKIATGVGKTAVGFDKLAQMGKQIATGEGVTSSTGQLVRDLAQAAPGAIGTVGAGAALDVGLGAATTETPGERAGFTPFGTILGGVGAARGVTARAVSGHIIAPRAWGSEGVPQRPENFSSNFPALNAEHTDAMATAPAGVQQRFNAVQKFLDGAAPGTQLVYAPRPEAGTADRLPQTLQETGINPAFADQDGFQTKVTGADGNEHSVIVVRDLEAAPHEARHAMDDVIGASAVENLNAAAKKEFADKWESFKQGYADRLTPTGLPTSDPNGTILRETGEGDAAAKEKIITQARESLGANATEAQVKEEAGKAITDLQKQADDAGTSLWEHVLTPEEQSHVVDQYIGGEVRAEHHDAWFKAGQPGTLRGKMAMAAASVAHALGINPLEGRVTDYGTPLEGSLVKQASKSAPKIEMAPEAPAAEGSPAAQQQAVRNAQKAQAEASNQPVPGAVKTQKEVLGIIAEAIARKQGVKLTGLFAPDEPAASLTSDRETRRAMIEAFRTMPDAAKKLWGKLFFPENVPVTARGGNLQIFGWAPEVFAANAHKVAGALNALADKGVNMSPYELDPVTKTFTEQGWRDLYDDTQKFVKNQMAGRTGSGVPLVVPESVTKAGGSAPPLRGETEALSQDRADFINSLFNAKLPDTGLARQGAINMPLNKAGQLVSAATIPGRVEPPVQPRGTFRGAVAVRQGVKGEPIMEVNPFRNQFEAALKQAGIENPSLIEVNQRLNLKNIKDVELAPEQGQMRANTLTLQAGFQPPKSPKEFLDFLDQTEPDDFSKQVREYNGKLGGGQTGLSFDIGSQVKTPEELSALRSASEKFQGLSRAALKEKDFNSAIVFASKSQAAREAFEAASDEGGSGDFIRKHYDPAYKGPMSKGGPTNESANFQPKGKMPPELENEDLKSANRTAAVWMSPSGQLYNANDAHLFFARQHIAPGEENAVDAALAKGWMRIQNQAGYMTGQTKGLSAKQQSRLDALADDTGKMIVGDNMHTLAEPTMNHANFQPPKAAVKFAEDEGFKDMDGKLVPMDDRGRVTLYHWTTPESAKAIRDSGTWKSNENTDETFFTTKRDSEYGSGFGSTRVSVKIPVTKLRINDASHGELHFAVKNSDLAGVRPEYGPAKLMHSLEGIKRMNDEELARQERGRAETETTRASSYAGDPETGLVLHSAKQRSTVFLRPGSQAEQFKKDWDAAKTQDEKNHLVEAHFQPRKSINSSNTEESKLEVDKIPNTSHNVGSFMAKRKTNNKTDEKWELKPESSQFTKAWILPNGELAQFGGTWHHDWLNDQPKLRKQYNIPEVADASDADKSRVAALKSGFARVNYDKYNGKLTVEARESDWPNVVPSVQELVKNNLGKFDSLQVHLLDKNVKKLSDSDFVSFLDIPKEERVANIPFAATEGKISVAQQGSAGEEGSNQLFKKATSAGFGKASFQPPKLPSPKPEEFAHEDTIETALAKPNWAILTGTQEAQGAHDAPENVANNERLYNELAKNGYTPIQVSGSYQGVDQGRNFLVTGIGPNEALDWGKRFKQDSVLTPQGLLYSDGSIQPPDAAQNKIGKSAEKEPFFSRVENGPAFSLGFDEKIKPAAEEMVLGDLGTKKPLSSKQVGDMTKAELAAHYPESIIPRAKDDEIGSNIVGSPLAKEAGSRPAAVKAFADKLVDLANSQSKSTGYQAGLKWYSEFVPKLKKVYGKNAQIMAELLAATSPNNAPDTNFAFANDALEGYLSGRFDKQIAKFGEGLTKIEDGSWQPWLNRELKAGKVRNPPASPSEATFLDHWITKHNLNPRQSNGQLYSMHSVPVLRVFARRWLENTSGPKTQNFVRNLLGTGHEATIDVWADRTMRRLGYADHQARWRILPKNGTGVSDADFAFSQEAFRQAADALGIEADALQGGLWFAEKQLWAGNGWGRLDLGDYRKEIAKVEMLKSGITQRLNVQKAKAKAVQLEQPELLVSPRP